MTSPGSSRATRPSELQTRSAMQRASDAPSKSSIRMPSAGTPVDVSSTCVVNGPPLAIAGWALRERARSPALRAAASKSTAVGIRAFAHPAHVDCRRWSRGDCLVGCDGALCGARDPRGESGRVEEKGHLAREFEGRTGRGDFVKYSTLHT